MQNHKILLTGGLGYIGSHTAIELIDSGAEVVILDNCSSSSKDALNRIELITGKRPAFIESDIRDTKTVQRTLIEHASNSVIHFAAHKFVGESIEHPLKYYSNNVTGIISLLEAMLNADVQNLVFSSSCTVYGESKQQPVTELAPRRAAKSPYGNTKIICEDIINDTVKSSKLRAISLRYFNPIGAHESIKNGEPKSQAAQNILPLLMRSAADTNYTFSVFGNNYDTRDGTCERDYIHVSDLADAHMSAVNFLRSHSPSKHLAINIGTGKSTTVLELISHFEDATGQIINYQIVNRRPGDIQSAYSDTSKAKSLLDWHPRRTLNEAIRSAWEWYNAPTAPDK